jgi:AraC family transcriptional regulator
MNDPGVRAARYARARMRETTAADYRARLLRAERLLADRLDEPVDPAALAKAASFSLHHFHRIFRAQMGESVMEHVRRLRLERAAKKLRASEARILDLAIEAGFESHEAFTRAFAAHFGVPPSEYREQPNQRVLAWERSGVSRPAAEVAVQTYPAIRIAYRRRRGGYAGIHEFWQAMREWAAARDLLRGATLYGVCPDDPEITDEPLLRFDACVIVSPEFVPDETVAIGEIPAGTYAVGLHRGPYFKLHETYLDVIGRWFPSSGYELAPDAVVEHYLDDPTVTPEPDLRTEVRVRIAD